LNVLPPSIQPHASGHIIEQIEMAKKIQEAGLAYESNGSLYFDVKKYNQNHNYGILSGRNLDEVIANTRSLDGQDEKRDQVDFALWKKASPEHIMRWKSPWSDGFPGWHMECSAMSTKYLGENFDIHGGGMDLKFPHHESEIAQSVAANGSNPVKYWMHNNMVTINGQKMGKSLGNFITLQQFFTGEHSLLEKKYDPMTIRFFMLQAHYRSTLDFSNEALQAAEKGWNKLLNTVRLLPSIKSSETSGADISALISGGFEALDDDFNTPVLIAQLFEATRLVNLANDGKMTLTASDIQNLKTFFEDTLFTILGLTDSFSASNPMENVTDGLINLILEMRLEARKNKDWAASDKLRDQLKALRILVKDSKEGSTWEWDLN
ncbi:MAG: cysteine--tRNA ligase, partial [Bacteroidales bacterium]|nr:cysteine--tRNA ligase [Bacteroidales bacterium]